MISREEAKGIIYNEVLEATAMLATRENTEEETKCLERFIEASNMAIEALSQPERPKGRWICEWDAMMGETDVTCSHCKDTRTINGCYVGCNGESLYDEDNFCPNCGADMREIENE